MSTLINVTDKIKEIATGCVLECTKIISVEHWNGKSKGFEYRFGDLKIEGANLAFGLVNGNYEKMI